MSFWCLSRRPLRRLALQEFRRGHHVDTWHDAFRSRPVGCPNAFRDSNSYAHWNSKFFFRERYWISCEIFWVPFCPLGPWSCGSSLCKRVDWLALHASVLQYLDCVVSETHIVNYSFKDDRRYQRNLRSWGGGGVYSVGPYSLGFLRCQI